MAMLRNSLVRWAVLSCLLASAFSQVTNPPPSPDTPDTVLRISVNLVQMDAVVTDAKGKQVTDLTADDFEILQNGKRQKITHFSYITTGSTTAAAPRVTPANLPKNTPPPPPVRLRPEQVRRTIAMVVDDLGLSFESTAQVRSALKKFVDEQMQPGDLVAIVRTGAGMGALQQFTADKRQLYAAIERVRYNMIGRAGVSAFAPIGGSDSDPGAAEGPIGSSVGSGMESEIDRFRDEYFSVGTLGAINFIVRGLKEMPGRKAVVLLSDSIRIFDKNGFNDRIMDSMRQLTDQANRASVVIYTIDPRGLQTLSLTAADNLSGHTAQGINQRQEQRRTQFFESQDGLSYLAKETGGLFIHDTNDIGGGIRTVLDDQRGYYLIGYTPDDATFQQLKNKSRPYHKISVKVKKAGLHVRSRSGFYGVPDQDSRPVYRTKEEQLYAGLASPFGGGGVHLRLTALFANSAKDGSFIQSLLHIDGKDLTFSDEPDGWHKCVVDILVVTFGDSGVQVDQSSKSFTIRMKGATYQSALDHGFVYTMNHPVKKAGAYQLRTAVRDAGTARVGSASQFIEVPDISKGRLALSGIVVRSALTPAPPKDAGEPEGQAAVESDPDGGPAVRLFHPGKKVDYALQVMNAQEDKETHKLQLETQLLLFRDGKQVYTGKLTPFTPQLGDTKKVVTAGQLQLGSRMEPGEYTMQVAVTDKLAKEKARTASQWIDFEIAK